MKKLLQWWLNVNLKIRLVSTIILLIALLVSSVTFVILMSVNHQEIYIGSHFCKDFSLLFIDNILDLLENNDYKALESLIEKIYLAVPSVSYIQFSDMNGIVLLSFPKYELFFQHIVDSNQNTALTSSKFFLFNTPILSYFINPFDHLIDVIMPLVKNHMNLGILRLGCNAYPSFFRLSKSIHDLSIIVFVSIWLMFILGVTFNSVILNEPMENLLEGLDNMAYGNFYYKLHVSPGKWQDLFISFNQMSERLQSYEKKNVDQLTSEKVKLETLVSNIADGAILLDTELRLLFVNQVAAKVLHWGNENLIGSPIFQHLPIHINEILLPVVNSMVKTNCLDNSTVQTQEFCVSLRYESIKTCRFLLTTVLDKHNKELSSIVLIIQDITQEIQLNEAKNKFISNVSHELRTPLCNIGSFLETLMDYDHRLSNQQKTQFLGIAYNETKRLNRLVNDILDLSKLETQHYYILSSVKLLTTIVYITQLYQIIALNQKIQIVLEISTLINTIFAHESSFCQILSNLISNALKFTHIGGKIIVRAYPLFNYRSKSLCFKKIRIEVIDEGIGIDKMFLKQIFYRFMRIENYIHTLQGTGLGLSIVKSIIEKYNSQITVYSEVSVGTSFWFDLSVGSID